jgi:hypothetical protein
MQEGSTFSFEESDGQQLGKGDLTEKEAERGGKEKGLDWRGQVSHLGLGF